MLLAAVKDGAHALAPQTCVQVVPTGRTAFCNSSPGIQTACTTRPNDTKQSNNTDAKNLLWRTLRCGVLQLLLRTRLSAIHHASKMQEADQRQQEALDTLALLDPAEAARQRYVNGTQHAAFTLMCACNACLPAAHMYPVYYTGSSRACPLCITSHLGCNALKVGEVETSITLEAGTKCQLSIDDIGEWIRCVWIYVGFPNCTCSSTLY